MLLLTLQFTAPMLLTLMRPSLVLFPLLCLKLLKYFLNLLSSFFFFNDTATPEIYPLSLHDPLPISLDRRAGFSKLGREVEAWKESPQSLRNRARAYRLTRSAFVWRHRRRSAHGPTARKKPETDRKSTRLNSSHLVISYAVFCLKKKK